MVRGLIATLLLLPAVAMAQTPPSKAECDAVCQVNNALKHSGSAQTAIGSRGGNTLSMQRKGGIVPGTVVAPAAGKK